MAPTKVTGKSGGKTATKKKNFGSAKNYDLGSGITKYSRNDQYRRRLKYKLKDVKRTKATAANQPAKKKLAITVVKKIGGAKNGGERIVRLQKNKSFYTAKRTVRSRGPGKLFKDHKRNTRKNLVPGRVVILLAGRHKGKRVIVMKALTTGLLLVNGPYYLNRCPLRRVSQRYVIATKTRVNLKSVQLPEHLNDAYFKRPSKKGKNKNAEGDIFAKKEEKYLPSEQRKQDQKAVDKQVKAALKTHRLYNVLKKYLKEPFGLKTNQYPHRMRF